jgi:hypothetical protein
MSHLFKRLQNLGDMLPRAGFKSLKKIREGIVLGTKPLNFWLLKHPLRKQEIAFGTAQYPKMAPYAPNINGPRTASEALALAK